MSLRMVKSPFLLGQRHPRYTFALVALLVCAYWFFFTAPPPPRPVVYKHNHELKARLDREERKYRDMLPQRQELITKYGPTPSQVAMYVASVCICVCSVGCDFLRLFSRSGSHQTRNPGHRTQSVSSVLSRLLLLRADASRYRGLLPARIQLPARVG